MRAFHDVRIGAAKVGVNYKLTSGPGVLVAKD
jgi:hypothetical protein